jgi:serine/threonine-protein kinase
MEAVQKVWLPVIIPDRYNGTDVGEHAGHYELLAAVATGGAGVVYRARDMSDGSTVAVKILRSTEAQDADLRHRFLREGRAIQRLSHPNVVRYIDTGETSDGLPFLVTEFVEGGTLRDLLEGGPLPLAAALNAARQIAAALAATHSAGIVHRDVKPENFMVTRDGTVKMLDFGLSRIEHSRAEASRATKAGTILGSVHYLSPEQARGDAVDERTDIWSVGVLLYEMLTGQVPFNEASCVGTLLAIVEKPAPPLPDHAAPRETAAVVARCLRKSAAERFESAGALLEALSAAAEMAEPVWKRLFRRVTR